MKIQRFAWATFAGLLAVCAAAHAQNSSTTLLSATPSSVNVGEGVALTAAVQVAAGDPAPTGTITFKLGNQAFAQQTLERSTAEFVGSATGFTPGVYSITASYSGDANTAASQSAPVSITLNHFPTQTTLQVAPTIKSGSTATATASVTAPGSNQPLNGSVSFFANGEGIANVPVSNGKATLTASTAGYADGSYVLTAHYNGDTWNGTSSSSPVSVKLSGITSLSFSITPEIVQQGTNANISVSVSTDSNATPTGSVTFKSGSTVIGTVALSNGAASFPVNSAAYPPGQYTVTASYSGDANNDAASAKSTVIVEGTAKNFAITPAGAAITPGSTASFSVSPASSTAVTWYVNGIAGGNSTVGTINASGTYTAPANAAPLSVNINATEASNPYIASASAPVYVVVPGGVYNSNDAQVAKYQISVPQQGLVSVEFGPTTSYGRNTWQIAPPSGGGAVTLLVAGINANATSHMRADVAFPGGITYHDPDHTFAAGYALGTLARKAPPVTITTSAYTPQPGIELADPIDGQMWAYDLQGNFIWGLNAPPDAPYPSIFQPVKVLADGNVIAQVTPESAFPVDGSVIPSNSAIAVYELELDGTIVKELTIAQLNTNLQKFGYKDGQGNSITLLDMHHDVEINPVNNHWILISNTTRPENLTGISGTTTVLGDVIVDVDPNNNFAVDWVWNEFDYLDVNRHPVSVTDWTHTNAVVYSPTDHQLLVSSRHQSWIMKVDYKDGAGSGALLWRLGYQGDFTLENGTYPSDWQYMQHEPAFTTTNSDGVFGLTMMDNGDDRVFPAGVTCGATGQPPCHYSRMPQFTIDESAMTATLGVVPPYENYSYFGGNAETLANGDPHADFCAVADPNDTATEGAVVEFTPGDNPQLVWSMIAGQDFTLYRSHRVGSLYPGVTWNQ